MVAEFYFWQRCASPQLHKFRSLIYFPAQAQYGSELGKGYHNTICKPDLIQMSQESAHTNGLLDQYLQNLDLCLLTQRAYQLPTMVFMKLIINCIMKLAILDLPPKSLSVYPYRNTK